MHRSWLSELTGQATASVHVFAVSLRRLLRARQTVICLMLLSFAALAVVAWSMRRERSPADFVEEVFLTVYVAFLLPVFCLCYATAGIAADREEGTLVYLLITPIPRPLIFAAKSAASLVVSLAWTMGSLLTLCRLAGNSGGEVLPAVWPGMFWATSAYVALFLLFSVLFRRATIIAFAYALFLETFVGNVPGIAKRVAISFHARCVIFDSGANLGIGPAGPYNPDLFLPIDGATAQMILYALAGSLFGVGLLIFMFREYAR